MPVYFEVPERCIHGICGSGFTLLIRETNSVTSCLTYLEKDRRDTLSRFHLPVCRGRTGRDIIIVPGPNRSNQGYPAMIVCPSLVGPGMVHCTAESADQRSRFRSVNRKSRRQLLLSHFACTVRIYRPVSAAMICIVPISLKAPEQMDCDPRRDPKPLLFLHTQTRGTSNSSSEPLLHYARDTFSGRSA